jgi:hypothetical protein
MEKMSYSLIIRFDNLRSSLLVDELMHETNIVSQAVIQMPFNSKLNFSSEQLTSKDKNHGENLIDRLDINQTIYSLGLLDTVDRNASVLFESEKYMPELGAYYFAITDLRFDPKSPMSMAALFIMIAAARLFNVSTIEDSSGVWKPRDRQGAYEEIDLHHDLERLKIPLQNSYQEAIDMLYSKSSYS